ncbi:MAG: PilZ domain-containing protein [Sandaracinaceae bacterium]|nr:PilZ domain-containing protein [Sandaracinaceae bacterium]
MEQAQPIERRRHARFEVMAQVRVKRGRNAYVLDVLNVSESGALVDLGSLERPFWLARGRLVEMILFLPLDDVALAPITAWAEIVRVDAAPSSIRFAVTFRDPSGAIAPAIRHLVEVATPRPPPLPSRR